MATVNFIIVYALIKKITDVEKEDDKDDNVVKEGEVEEEEGEDEEGDNQKRYDFRKRKAVDRYQAPQKGTLLWFCLYQKCLISAPSALQKTFSLAVPP